MTELPADQPARLAALDPARSFIVEAPAGSGKTALLTKRCLRLLATVDEPEQVVALTFTRKAAQEIRGRVLEALRAASGPPPAGAFASAVHALGAAALARDRQRGWNLLDHPGRLRLQTIDALAASLARRMPLQSGLDPGVAVLEAPREAYREAARLAIAEIDQGGAWAGAARTLLAHLDNAWPRLEDLLADMLARRDQWLRLIAAGRRRAHLEASLGHVIRRALEALAAAVDVATRPALLALCRYAGGHVARTAPRALIARLADLPGLPATTPADLPGWAAIATLLLTRSGEPRRRLTRNEGFVAGDAQTAAMKTRFAEVTTHLAAQPGFVAGLHAARSLPPGAYTDAQWAVIEALLDLLVVAAAHLKVWFAEHAAVDFIDIAHAALAALGDADAPSDLGLEVDRRICHLLVDEFQDTSVTQYDLLERLIAGWSGDDGRSVFLVGDPLQSIYRFRQAEVQLFMATMRRRRIADVALERVRLSVNFRTQAAAVDWLNARFPAVLAGGGGTRQGYTPINAARRAAPGEPVRVHALADTAGEAARVRSIIEHERAADPGCTIAILVRGRRHLGAIPAALAAAGIAVSATDIDPLAGQPGVDDLVALTRALLHPADRVAWLAVLRAPWCGLDLAALTTLCGVDHDAIVWEQIHGAAAVRRLTRDDQTRLARCRDVLARALALAGRVRMSRLVEYTWVELGGPQGLDDPAELVHARHYFGLLERLDDEATRLSPSRLQSGVDELYAASPARGARPVEIMTVHRAKGLEFDVVILPGLARTPRAGDPPLLAWRETIGADTRAELLMAPIPAAGPQDDAFYTYLRACERDELAAESLRLLYVALTRARERVHLVATLEPTTPTRGRPDGRAFLGMLWPAIGADLAAQQPSAPPAMAGVPLAAGPPSLRRIALDAAMPAGGRRAPAARPRAALAALDFDWAGASARHVGTVTHAMLRRIGADGISRWDRGRIAQSSAEIRCRLRGFGVPAPELDAAAARVADALAGVLASDRGRWIMDERHDEIRSEFGLTADTPAGPVNVRIDRTFIDARGCRWIIDFKTGTHGGGALDRFLESERARYRPQLETYAAVLCRLETRPVALGLYFPLLDAWCEWPYPGFTDGA